MAAIVLLGLGAAYLYGNDASNKQTTVSESTLAELHNQVPPDNKQTQWDDIYNEREMYRRGYLPTDQYYWSVGESRRLTAAREPYPRRNPLPYPRQQKATVLEDVSMNMSASSKEAMRQQIEDCDFDEVQFRGERADYRFETQRRGPHPIINNPGLVNVTISQDSMDEPVIKPFRDTDHQARPFSLNRLNSEQYGYLSKTY